MNVYQSADGKWILWDGESKNYFSTEMEAVNMSQKLTFASKAQERATALAQNADLIIDQISVFYDRGYNVGGVDPIVDGDLTSLGITAAQLTAFITLAEQLKNFLDNAAVVTADYDATLSVMRNDV